MMSINDLIILKRNPQYLTPAQMDSLKESIKRDGFCAPILIRPLKKSSKFEIISGNHRFMASVELGLSTVPCIIADLSDRAAKRLAVNLNTIHGQPNPELLAPFLAEFDIPELKDVFIDCDLKKELLEWDDHLSKMFEQMEPPDAMNSESPKNNPIPCKCPICGNQHARKEE